MTRPGSRGRSPSGPGWWSLPDGDPARDPRRRPGPRHRSGDSRPHVRAVHQHQAHGGRGHGSHGRAPRVSDPRRRGHPGGPARRRHLARCSVHPVSPRGPVEAEAARGTIMPKIAFLGAGRMASAMVEGLLSKKARAVRSRLPRRGGPTRPPRLVPARTGISLARARDELLEGADTLVVAFKPQHLAGRSAPAPASPRDAWSSPSWPASAWRALRRVFPKARNIVRCMPNTPAQIGAGITGWCAGQASSPAADRATVERSSAPSANRRGARVPAGCGHRRERKRARLRLRIRGGAARCRRRRRPRPAVAETLAVETLLGSPASSRSAGSLPERLRDEVVSPNGTTFAGLQRLSAGGFRELIRRTRPRGQGALRGAFEGLTDRPCPPRRTHPRHRRSRLHRQRPRLGPQPPRAHRHRRLPTSVEREAAQSRPRCVRRATSRRPFSAPRWRRTPPPSAGFARSFTSGPARRRRR
jgi:pyrroline-5-carboxylate reductase